MFLASGFCPLSRLLKVQKFNTWIILHFVVTKGFLQCPGIVLIFTSKCRILLTGAFYQLLRVTWNENPGDKYRIAATVTSYVRVFHFESINLRQAMLCIFKHPLNNATLLKNLISWIWASCKTRTVVNWQIHKLN